MNDELVPLKKAVEAAADEVGRQSHRQLDPVWDKQLVLTLSTSILVFGILVILIMAYLVLKERNTTFVLRAFGVPLIIVAAIFLVVTGYSQDQIAPVIGLLGTIAGYLLGSRPDQERPTRESESNQTEETKTGSPETSTGDS